MKPSWKGEWRERVDWEIDTLQNAGANVTVEHLDAETCQCTLSVEYPLNEVTLDLKVRFPPYYPLVKFEASTASISLAHHQGPNGGNLCLLTTEAWSPHDTVWSLLQSQLPRLLEAGSTSDADIAKPFEVDQAEPASNYVEYKPESVILYDDRILPSASNPCGSLALRVQTRKLGTLDALYGQVISFDNGPSTAKVLPALSGNAPNKIRWQRFEGDIKGVSPKSLYEKLQSLAGGRSKSRAERRSEAASNELIGVVFREELSRRKEGTSLIFLHREVRSRKESVEYVRANRFGQDTLSLRAPELKHLKDKTVAIVGLGCIGAPIAIELARSGVKCVKLIDFDWVDAATIVRWPLGALYAGRSKVTAVAEFILHNYPLTNVIQSFGKVGGIENEGGLSLEQADSLFCDADVIVDAVGEKSVSRILSLEAQHRGIKHVFASTTSGGWGGTVGILDPSKEPCFDCFLLAMRQDAPAESRIPIAPRREEEGVQAPSCSDPTFTAAGFDTTQVSLAAVRAVTSALSQDTSDYPILPKGIWLLSLRDGEGVAQYPSWDNYSLTRSPLCENHT